ncbi:MAG: hypothetical protein HOY78_39435, partial [Saccharothrix sp.]|nr:hypothetical protein [Saccharothrix sp.]
MRRDRSLPTYEQLFGALDFRAVDEGRSVYSPAAYLADLLDLIDDTFEGDPLTGPDRRPDIASIPLDGEHAYTEVPYLDVVNRVLAAVVGPDAHAELKRLRFPFALPFDLDHEKVRRYLSQFRVGPVELYHLFARRADRDVVAREFLGLSADDVALVTTVVTDHEDLLATFYGVDGSFDDLHDVATFLRATRLTATELDALVNLGTDAFVHQGGPRVTLDATSRRLVRGDGPVPPEWFERVSRFVRLARRIGLTLNETDIVLRRCCGNRIDPAALHVLAVVVHLHRALDLPVDVVTALAGPVDGGLFERVFNEPFAAERTVIAGPSTPRDGVRVLTASGDVLAPRNQEYRVRVSRAVGLSEADLVTTVRRVRQRYSGTVAGSGPFDHDVIGLDALSLLHRVGRLTRALDITATDLFGVLDALANDPSSVHASAFGGLLDTSPESADPYLLLEARDVGSGLALAQLLLGVVPWMRALGMDSAELGDVLGRTTPGEIDEDWDAVRARLNEKLDEVGLTPDLFGSERFGPRAAQVLHDVLTRSDGVVAQDHRVLRLDPALVETAAAYDAVTDLVAITEEDFRGLGLAEPLAGKVFTNLVLTGLLDSSGTLVDDRLPTTQARFHLSHDFTAVREPLFALIAGCATADPAGCYPSDLARLGGLADDLKAELYDNLVVLGHLDPSGEILAPQFFREPGNATDFTTTVPLDAVAPQVFALLHELAERARTEPVAVDPDVFADIALTARQRADLLDSLRFNGHIDADGHYVDPTALARLPLDGFGLAVTFHPHRAAILRAIQDHLATARAGVLTVGPERFREIADHAAARAVAEALDGTYLDDDVVPDEIRAFFADPDNAVSLTGSPWERLFPPTDLATITHRIATILTDQRPYRFDLDAIAALDFDADETTRLVAVLVARGDL